MMQELDEAKENAAIWLDRGYWWMEEEHMLVRSSMAWVDAGGQQAMVVSRREEFERKR